MLQNFSWLLREISFVPSRISPSLDTTDVMLAGNLYPLLFLQKVLVYTFSPVISCSLNERLRR
jgi:hypothetical protein